MCSQENYIDCLAFSVHFSNCQFGFPVLEYYLVVKVHLHIWLTLTVKKIMWKHIFIEFWGKLLSCHIRNSKTWISINHIFANEIQIEGITTGDIDTKTYLMS
jgi:hypothetical protein